jgi:hypothetical protein
MTRDFTLIVSGFGRCGSSLVMQMLHAGGFPTTGDYPAFEDERYSLGQKSAPLGVAVKILDPHKFHMLPGHYRWIWLDRDPRQQAKSQVKFLRHVAGLSLGKEAVSKFAKSFKDERPACMAAIKRIGGPLLQLRFENIVNSPDCAAQAIGGFVGCCSHASMAAVIVRRSPTCLPYLLEAELLEAHDDGAPCP